MHRKLIKVLLVFVLIVAILAQGGGVQAAKKYTTRNDNLFVRDKGDFHKDTLKVGNKVYYTLDDWFYSFNIKTKKKKKILKIKGGADKLFYCNKNFFVVSTYGNEKIEEESTQYYYDVYKLNLSSKKADKILDNIDDFIGYCKGKYWYAENGSLMATTKDQISAEEYIKSEEGGIGSGTLDNQYIYYVSTVRSSSVDEDGDYEYNSSRYRVDAYSGEKIAISDESFFKMSGMGTSYTFPEKGVNNGRSSSIVKNLANDWSYLESNYFNDSGIRKVQTFKKKKKIDFYVGPAKKLSQAVCLFDKYVVVRIAGKTTSQYVLLNNKGKVVGKLGKEKYKLRDYTRWSIRGIK